MPSLFHSHFTFCLGMPISSRPCSITMMPSLSHRYPIPIPSLSRAHPTSTPSLHPIIPNFSPKYPTVTASSNHFHSQTIPAQSVRGWQPVATRLSPGGVSLCTLNLSRLPDDPPSTGSGQPSAPRSPSPPCPHLWPSAAAGIDPPCGEGRGGWWGGPPGELWMSLSE